jgi:hypothetical protein
MLVKPRRSANSTATSCSLPWLTSPPNSAFGAVICGGSSGWMVTAPVGRVWQASRTPGAAWMRASTRCSSSIGGGNDSAPSITRTRQVEQRLRPPHTAAWGMPPMRLASSKVVPGWMTTRLPSG